MTGGDDSALHTRPSLLLRIRDAGDMEAWRLFVEIYAPVVHRYGIRRGLQDADAADLMQEVMGDVARGIRAFQYQPSVGRFRDWLLTVTRHRLIRLANRAAHLPASGARAEELEAVTDCRSDPDWQETFHSRVLSVALERIKSSFEPVTWRAFESVWLKERPASETAKELSLRIHSVYVAKWRVLKRLETEVRELAEEFCWLDLAGAAQSSPEPH
jgi:RNA polymerase sigma-70 factor (ECF subfamily)